MLSLTYQGDIVWDFVFNFKEHRVKLQLNKNQPDQIVSFKDKVHSLQLHNDNNNNNNNNNIVIIIIIFIVIVGIIIIKMDLTNADIDIQNSEAAIL